MVKWLHLSDLHFKSQLSYDQDLVTNSLVTSISQIIERFGKPNFIVASGDIGNTGVRSEYANATRFFDELLSKTYLDKKALFIIPGNHDVNRSKSKGLSRTLKDRNESDDYFSDPEAYIHISRKQGEFVEWYDAYFKGISQFPINTTVSRVFSGLLGDQKVSVTAINTALFCQGDDDSGNLWIGRYCLDKYLNSIQIEDEELALAVMHHPADWLNHEEASLVRTALRDKFDCILSGHLHENEVQHTADDQSNTILFAAGAAYQTTKWPNTALYCEYSGGNVLARPLKYIDKPRPTWTLVVRV